MSQNATDDSQSQPISQYIQCPKCCIPKFFKGARGLKSHISRMHKDIALPDVTQSDAIHSTPTHSQTSNIDSFCKIISNLKMSVPLIKRIPRGARIAVASRLSSYISKCLKNTTEDWQTLFTYSYKVFYIDKRNLNNVSVTQQIKNNITKFQIPEVSLNKGNNRCFRSNKNTIIEEKVYDGDLKGATKLLFSEDTIAGDSPETLSALRAKHPDSNSFPLSSQPTVASTPILQTSEKEITAAIMSFPAGSASGLDGLSPQHFKDLISKSAGDAGLELLTNLTKLINLILSGKINNDFIPTLFGAKLCAFTKKDGGIRPIAIGSTIRRLSSKIACQSIQKHLGKLFQPVQLGFGTKGGCEAAVHSLRTFVMDGEAEVILKIDVKNAFNSVSRDCFLTEVYNHIPSIYPYLYQSYSQKTNLLYNSNILNSSVGCQQGDPLGPAIFSLAIHPIISTLNSLFNVWYLDDGTLGGGHNVVLSDLINVISAFENIGLQLNLSKCELFISNNISSLAREEIISKFLTVAPDIKILNQSNFNLLGSPIFEDSVTSLIHEKIDNFTKISEKICKLNYHVGYIIAKHCLFIPKIMYLLRTSPIWKFFELTSLLDATIKEILQKMFNLNFNGLSWTQLTLPIRYGGIGIRKINSVALPGFLSSIYSVSGIISKILRKDWQDINISYLDESLTAWSLACPNGNVPMERHKQKHWDIPIVQATHANLLKNSSNLERARLLAVSTKESGQWLQAIPNPNLGTLLDNQTFQIAVALRLGVAFCEPHRCPCGGDVDVFGRHGLSCSRSAGRFARHSLINNLIRRSLAAIHIPSILEPQGLFRDDGKRPDGLSLVPWKMGRCLVWDATCVDTLATSHLLRTMNGAGNAAEDAEDLKRRKYSQIANNYIFVPFGVETMGSWGPNTLGFIKKISSDLIDVTGDQRAGSYLFQRLSLIIQRGNVASVLGTMPRDNCEDLLFF